MKKYLPEISREELENTLLNFAHRNDALHRTIIISTALIKFKHTKDYKMLEEALVYTFSLLDHVPYDKAGQYRNVIYPILTFFRESVSDSKVLEILERVLPILEDTSCLLQDEGS
ncbi:MAG: hypothetical protein WCG27_02530 [Pseudomonadota bacterium]